MKVKSLTLKPAGLPEAISNIPQPPQQLYWTGIALDTITAMPRVAIVGSRQATNYGRRVTYDLATKLARGGVVIISGLAYGIDSLSHKATIEAGGCTVAVLPSPIEKIYPAAHHGLADQILKRGGALVSEYPEGTGVRDYSFIARNRLISALAEVVVIPEAARNSGSLHTARFALEQGKTIMAVPGDINSPMSEGCNNLIKSGAIPVTTVDDIFFALKIQPEPLQKTKQFSGPPEQQVIFGLIADGLQDQEEIAVQANLPASDINSALTVLELKGYIRPIGNGHWVVA